MMRIENLYVYNAGPPPNRVVVRRALHAAAGRMTRNWNVFDYRHPTRPRQFTFSNFSAAMTEADSLARTGRIGTYSLVGFQKLENKA